MQSPWDHSCTPHKHKYKHNHTYETVIESERTTVQSQHGNINNVSPAQLTNTAKQTKQYQQCNNNTEIQTCQQSKIILAQCSGQNTATATIQADRLKHTKNLSYNTHSEKTNITTAKR